MALPILCLLHDLLAGAISKIIDLICTLIVLILFQFRYVLWRVHDCTYALAWKVASFNADTHARLARLDTAEWLTHHPASVLCFMFCVAWAVRCLIALVRRYSVDDTNARDTNARDSSVATKRCPCLLSDPRASERKSYYGTTRVARTRMPFAVAHVATVEEKIEEGNEEEAKREEGA